MIINRAYKFQLYPNEEQKTVFAKTFHLQCNVENVIEHIER